METEECIIVVDFEATCDRGGRLPPDQMELIEIGAVKVRVLDGEILSTFRSFIRPVHRPVLSQYCIDLTGIQQGDVNGAPSFARVLKQFKDWLNHPFWTWGSWGDFDAKILDNELRNASESGIFTHHVNLKSVASKLWSLKKTGLKETLNFHGMHVYGDHHRALDDARSIAQLVPLMVDSSEFHMFREGK